MTKPIKAQKKESSIKTLKDVIFMFTSVSQPREQLNTDNKPPLSSPDSPTFNLEFHSYEVKCLIPEKTFKGMKKTFKGAKNLTHAKEFTKEELVEKYSYLNEDDLDDDMYLVKFSQSALVGKPDKNGVRRESFPIKQIGIKGKVQDSLGNNIDQETGLGNGTKGHFQFKPVESAAGLYLYPHLICVTELVIYEGGGEGEEDLEALGLEELDEVDMKKVAEEATEDTFEDEDMFG